MDVKCHECRGPMPNTNLLQHQKSLAITDLTDYDPWQPGWRGMTLFPVCRGRKSKHVQGCGSPIHDLSNMRNLIPRQTGFFLPSCLGKN